MSQLLSRVKTLLNLTNHEQDEKLLILIEDTEHIVSAYTNYPIEEFPRSFYSIITKMVLFQYEQQQREGKTSESLADYSVSFESVSDFPTYITKGLKRRLSWS